MAASPYTIFCLVFGEDTAFSVDIAETKTVDHLKKAIKIEKPNDFANIDADKLTLYLINLPAAGDLEQKVNQLFNSTPALEKLEATDEMSDLFPQGPKRKTVHILVQIPNSGSKRTHQSSKLGFSSSDSEATDDKRKRVKSRPRLSDPSDVLYSRRETVEELYELLEKHRFIFVRGTPASGKSSLAYLLRTYINNNHPKQHVHMLTRYRDCPTERSPPTYRQWLAEKGWEFKEGGVLILDEAQLSYWDSALWDEGLKPISSSTPYMVILFASYGSATRDLLPRTTPFRVRDEQLVGLARNPSSPVGLLLTREEMEGVVKKNFPDHRFDDSLLEYVYDLTSGHVGACCDAFEVIKVHSSYREKLGDIKYTYDDFILSVEMAEFLEQLYKYSVFSRGLPTQKDLGNPKYAKSLLQVLENPERFVVVTEEQDRNSNDPLRQCLERGWLFSEGHGAQQIKYRFASPLHEVYTTSLLLGGETVIKDSDLHTFVVQVITKFTPQNLQTREDLRSSSDPPQSIPEAQFQQEFYRACHRYTGGCVTTFPECGTAKGRIEFFIRSKKWGVELLRDGDKLSAHNARFTNGEYGKWLKEGKMEDYIMIDFRSKKPNHLSGDIQKLIYVVSTDSWKSVQIYNPELELISSFHLLYH